MPCSPPRLLPALTAWGALLLGSAAVADDPKEPAGRSPGDETPRAQPPSPLAPLTPAQEATLDAIVDRLRSPNAGTAQAALAELEPWARHAKKALPALLEFIRKGDDPADGAAGRVVGRMGPEGAPAVPDLIQLLDGQRVSVDIAVLDALSGLGPVAAPAVPSLLRLSKTSNEGLSALALGALTEIDPAHPDVLVRFESALRYGRCSPGMTALNGLLRAGRPGWAVLAAATLSDGFASLRVARSEFSPRAGESPLQFLELCCALIDDGREVLVEIGRRSIEEIREPDASCVPPAVRRLLATPTTADSLIWLRLLSRVAPQRLPAEALRAVPRLREIAASSDPEAKSLAEGLLSRLAKDGGIPASKPGDR